MEEAKIKAWGYTIKSVMVGLAAIIGAYKAPEAISNYAVSVKVQSVMENTLNSVQKIVNNNNNSNSNINYFNFAKDQSTLLKAFPTPDKFKQAVENTAQDSLAKMGLTIPKAEFQQQLDKAKTKEEYKETVKKNLPAILYFDDIKVNIDDVKDFDKGE